MSDKSRERKEREARNHFAMAQHHLHAKNYTSAIDCLTKALSKHATAENFVCRASAYLQLDDGISSWQRAMDDLNQALKLDPTNIKAVQLKATLLSIGGSKIEAQNLLDQTAHSHKDAKKLDETKEFVNNLKFTTAHSIPYKNELFEVDMMGQQAMDREKNKSIDLRTNWTSKGPVYLIKKLQSQKSPAPAGMHIKTLEDLKDVLDQIDSGGGFVWNLAFDNIALNDEMMKFFRSLKSRQISGNNVNILKVKCDKLEYFAELFSGKLLNPMALWLDRVDDIQGFDLQKAVSEYPALKNVKQLKLNMALSNELFQKSILQPAYFPDISALFEFVERPLEKEKMRLHFPIDQLPPQHKLLIESEKRKLDLDAIRLGIDLAKFKQICIQRFHDARSPSATYRIEISSKQKPVGLVDEEQRSRGGLLFQNQHTGEVMVFTVLESDMFGADGKPKLWQTLVERKSMEQLQKDMQEDFQRQAAAAGFTVRQQ